jgi:hypothetical protein
MEIESEGLKSSTSSLKGEKANLSNIGQKILSIPSLKNI